MSTTRYSYGIALCKRDRDGLVRLLMANKRYTYAFFQFVCGRFNERSDADMIALLDNMTMDEKIDILSLNFQQIWYRIWLSNSNPNNGDGLFFQARGRFNEHIASDGGTRIRSLLRRSHFCAERVWEIPKGRKKNQGEYELECAIREFYEETGIPRNAYHIVPRATFLLSFTEDGRRYDITYYIAVTTRDITQRLNSASIDQITEICNLRWVSAAEMDQYAQRDLAGHRRIIRRAKRLLRPPP